jgi:anaerobic magnesium-protoporphyrin IX monomethyl ester cyclase
MPLNSYHSICFIHTPCPKLENDRLEPPLGLLYLATIAKIYRYETKLLDLSSVEMEHIEEKIPNGYDVYAFSTYSVNYNLTKEIAKTIKNNNPSSLFIAGGPHASALPDCVYLDGFNYVITGEADITLFQLLEKIKNKIPVDPIAKGVSPSSLDEIPFPDYSLIEFDTYSRVLDNNRCVSILSSRGCPYNCVFCNSNIIGTGKSVRYRSPENIVREIRQIKTKYGIQYFRFQDDLFTNNKKRVYELTTEIQKESIKYRCFSRVNNFDPFLARRLSESGLIHVSFGVESGSNFILKQMQKKQNTQQIEKALSSAYQYGIRTRIFLIVGFPGETDATIKETVSFLKKLPWDEFSVYPLIAYPGTKIHTNPHKYGIIHVDKTYEDYLQIGKNLSAGFTIRTNTFDEEQVHSWRDNVINEFLADGRTWAGQSHGYQ